MQGLTAKNLIFGSTSAFGLIKTALKLYQKEWIPPLEDLVDRLTDDTKYKQLVQCLGRKIYAKYDQGPLERLCKQVIGEYTMTFALRGGGAQSLSWSCVVISCRGRPDLLRPAAMQPLHRRRVHHHKRPVGSLLQHGLLQQLPPGVKSRFVQGRSYMEGVSRELCCPHIFPADGDALRRQVLC